MYYQRLSRILFLLISISLPPLKANAAVYSVPQASWRLGSSFDPLKPMDRFADCFRYDEEVSGAQRLDAGVTEWRIERVEKREDLYKTLGISASISASTLFSSGSVSADYALEESFHSDSLTWVLVGKTTFNPVTASNLRLKRRYENFSLDELKRRCGTEVVVSMKRQVQIAAIFTLSQIAVEKREKLKANLDFYSSGVLAVDVKSSLETLVHSAASTSVFNGKLLLVGGPGISELAALGGRDGINWKNPTDAFSKINQIINHYVPTMTYDRAVPFSFETALIDRFITCPASPVQGLIERTLNDLFFKHESIRTVENRIGALLETHDKYALEPEDTERFRNLRTNYSTVRCKIVEGALAYLTEKRDETGKVRLGIKGDWLEKITFEINSLKPVRWPNLIKMEEVTEASNDIPPFEIKTKVKSIRVSTLPQSSQYSWNGTSGEDRFLMRRAANDFCFAQENQIGGIFNGHIANGYMGVVCLHKKIADWFDRSIPARIFSMLEQLKRVGRAGPTDWRHWGRLAHNFCVEKKYASGFHNGHFDDSNGKMGIICLKNSNAKAFFVTEDKICGTHGCFTAADRTAHNWCEKQGWASGYFNGHEANPQGQRGFGVVCIK